MKHTALIKSIPAPIRAYIRREKKPPSEAMLRRNGYSVVVDGMFKWVAAHDTHVLKFARRGKRTGGPRRRNDFVDREVRMYDSLTHEQRRMVVPMVLLCKGISVAMKALVDDPDNQEILKWDGTAMLVKKIWKQMGIKWIDSHGGNIGFLPRRGYPVIIDLDYFESVK